MTLFLLLQNTAVQGRNHVFKVGGGPIPWSRVLLPFYRKKLDRSTQFDAVGYIITLHSSKRYVISWGSVQILGRSGPPTPQWLRPCCRLSFGGTWTGEGAVAIRPKPRPCHPNHDIKHCLTNNSAKSSVLCHALPAGAVPWTPGDLMTVPLT